MIAGSISRPPSGPTGAHSSGSSYKWCTTCPLLLRTTAHLHGSTDLAGKLITKQFSIREEEKAVCTSTRTTGGMERESWRCISLAFMGETVRILLTQIRRPCLQKRFRAPGLAAASQLSLSIGRQGNPIFANSFLYSLCFLRHSRPMPDAKVDCRLFSSFLREVSLLPVSSRLSRSAIPQSIRRPPRRRASNYV